MNNKLKELNVDFIGVQGQSLTKEDELAISAFIRASKEKKLLQAIRKGKIKTSQKSHQSA
jgi:hypothetical protein